MKNYILILLLASTVAGFAQQTTLTSTLVDRKYGFGYPSRTLKDNMGYPLIDHLVIPNIYDEVTNSTFKEEYSNLVGVKKDGKWGYIDPTGATKIPFKYDEAGYFHEGLAPVIAGGKCGFINTSGTVVIPLKYEYATSFTDGLAYVELGGKVGFINKTGTVVVPIKYDKQTDATYKQCYHCGGALYSFENGKAPVTLGGKCGTVDTKGNFTECKDEELITTTFTGVVNTNKNPVLWVKGSCPTNQDVRSITLNDKLINDMITNFDNQTMFHALLNFKVGDKVTLKIVHTKNCTYQLSGKLSIDLGEGQANLVAPEPKPLLQGLDSTTFFGTIIGAMAIIQSDQGAYDIKKVVLNDVDITAKLPVGQRKIINFAVYKLKKGQLATIKVVHTKTSTVKMLDPPGMDID